MKSSFFSDLDDHNDMPSEKESSFFSDLKERPSKLRSALTAPLKGVMKTGSKVNPFFISSIPEKLQEKVLEDVLPTLEEHEILERAGKIAPYVALGGEGLVTKGLQAGMGALLGQLAKEENLGEGAEGIAEIIGSGLPGIGKSISKAISSKKLLPKEQHKELIGFLRKKGLTDEQITPILQNPAKVSALSKLSFKYGKDNPFLKEIKSSLGAIYEDIHAKGEHRALTGSGLESFTGDLQRVLQKLPPFYRRTVKQEVEDLFAEPITYASLARFKDGVNRMIGETGRHGRKGVIGVLKGPIDNAMKHVDSSLFHEEKLVDQAYGKYKSFFKKMTSKDEESYLKLTKIAPVAAAVLTLSFNALPKLGVAAAITPFVSKRLLTDPRFQRVHAKMWKAFKEGKTDQVIKLSSMLEKYIQETSSIHNKETSQQ